MHNLNPPPVAAKDDKVPCVIQKNNSGFFPREAARIFYHICSPASHKHRLFPPPGGSEQQITDGEKNAVVLQGGAVPKRWLFPSLAPAGSLTQASCCGASEPLFQPLDPKYSSLCFPLSFRIPEIFPCKIKAL